MDELIKSEAGKHYEDQGYVLNKDDTELIIDTFTAGFNRCLELAKMDNEEEFEKWYALHWNMPEIKRYPSHGFENQEKAFLAAAKLKDVEIMELKSEYDQACSTLKNSSGYINTLEEKLKAQNEIMSDDLDKAGNDLFLQEGKIKELEEKLKVAVEALEYYQKHSDDEDNDYFCIYDSGMFITRRKANEALEKIKGEK